MADDVASLFGDSSSHFSTGGSFFDSFSQQPVSTSSQQAPNQPHQQHQQHQHNPQLHVETHQQAQYYDPYQQQQQQYEGNFEQTAGSATQADPSQQFAPDFYTYASFYGQDPNLQETYDFYVQWCATYYPGLPQQPYDTSAVTYDQQYSQQQQAPTVAAANESLVAGYQGAGHYEGQGQASVGVEPHPSSWESSGTPAPQTAFFEQQPSHDQQQQQQQQYSDHNQVYDAFQQDPRSFFDTLTPHDSEPTTTTNSSDVFGGHDHPENGAASANEDDDPFGSKAASKNLSHEHLDTISGYFCYFLPLPLLLSDIMNAVSHSRSSSHDPN